MVQKGDALVLLRDALYFAIPPEHANKAREQGAKPPPVKDTIRGGAECISIPMRAIKTWTTTKHMATYSMFCKLTLWSVIVLVVLMASLGYFLT